MPLQRNLQSAIYKYAAGAKSLAGAPAPLPAAGGAASARSMFDRPGGGDAQVRKQMYDGVFGGNDKPMTPSAPNPNAKMPYDIQGFGGVGGTRRGLPSVASGAGPSIGAGPKPVGNNVIFSDPKAAPAGGAQPADPGRTPSVYREGETIPGTGALDYMDKWYNPNTTNTDPMSAGEEGLMRAGQTAMGVGTAAGAMAAAVPLAGAALPATAQTMLGLGAGTTGGAVGTNMATLGAASTLGSLGYQATAAMPKPSAGGGLDLKAQDSLAESVKNLPPEQQKAKIQEGVQAHVAALPQEEQKGLQDLGAGNADTPEAKQFEAKVEGPVKDKYVEDEYAKQVANNPDTSPQQAGGIMGGIMEGWNNMPTEMKWMMGIGLGGGLLSLLGSMFGGGGGMGLLGMLGLGAAGMAGAAGGMFGGGAQNFMADAVSGIGKSMGMVPETLTDEQKKILLAKDPVGQLTSVGGRVPSREEAAQQTAAGRDQLGQIQMLNSMGGMTPRMLENMGLSAEEAQLAAKNVGTLSGAYSDQNSALNQHLQRGEEYAKPTWRSWAEELGTAHTRMFGGKSSSAHGFALAQQWAKEADEKALQDWVNKYRARGKGGRWVNTRQSSRSVKRVACAK